MKNTPKMLLSLLFETKKDKKMNKKLQNISKKSGQPVKSGLWSKKEKRGLLVAAIIVFSGLMAYYGIPVIKQVKNQKSLQHQFHVELAANKVCMVGDEIKFKEIRPVNIDGKTYWACCDKCEAKLNRNYKDTRFTTDPYSGIKISKADAVIFQNPEKKGKVLFFESSSNYNEYLKLNEIQIVSEHK